MPARVAHASEQKLIQKLMMMRPYQIYAVKAVRWRPLPSSLARCCTSGWLTINWLIFPAVAFIFVPLLWQAAHTAPLVPAD